MLRCYDGAGGVEGSQMRGNVVDHDLAGVEHGGGEGVLRFRGVGCVGDLVFADSIRACVELDVAGFQQRVGVFIVVVAFLVRGFFFLWSVHAA